MEVDDENITDDEILDSDSGRLLIHGHRTNSIEDEIMTDNPESFIDVFPKVNSDVCSFSVVINYRTS